MAARRWYLVHAKTGHELLARAHLERQAYETFLPRTHRVIRHARKIRNTVAAYFPGYLFVSLDPQGDRWRPINSTVGVLRLVTAAGAPLAAPPGLVEALIAQADERGVLALAQDLKPGETVRVIRGPFADQLGVVERLAPQDRVRVLLEIMNAHVPVDLDSAALARP